jgi:hypothetical protein
MQSDVQIRGWNGGEVLRNGLLGVGVSKSTELSVDRRGLVGGESGASTECHVFLGVSHAGKSRRRFVTADQVIFFDRYHRGQRIPNDHHAQSVAQSGSGYVGSGRLWGGGLPKA